MHRQERKNEADGLQGREEVGPGKEVSLGQNTYPCPSGRRRGGEGAKSCGYIRAGRSMSSRNIKNPAEAGNHRSATMPNSDFPQVFGGKGIETENLAKK